MASPLERSGSGGLYRNLLSEGGCVDQVIEFLLVLWEGINAFHDLLDPDEEQVAA
ncbi:hypothetical protein EG328_002077 [Venturia inaequalis]|uniref:Uncharacterized protein n=1 Tax=Venturia inaequalis TaxID=5025 RepID=A0A8H3YUZ2_VENIN|nr:hypothetical protein EG328_002077 [Venturia inaequalis]KAE9970857.1 hypothetical protein EG327_010131 [Venturia inaequalis]RDI86956.1 hypothetical protein Vi05172_g2997 [Venturia inaequalis]